MDQETVSVPVDPSLLITSLSEGQQKALALLPIFPVLLSIPASAILMYLVYKSNFDSPYRRILFGFSVVDIVSSINYAIGPFLLPSGTASQRIWAFGNAATCTASGTLMQFGFASFWYYGVVSYYFLFTVRYGMRLETFEKRWEIPMHCVSIGYPLVTSIVGAILGVYNESELGRACWVADYTCDADSEKCLSTPVGWVFAGVPVLLMLFSTIFNNLLIFLHVRKTIYKNRNRQLSRTTVSQRLMTALSFLQRSQVSQQQQQQHHNRESRFSEPNTKRVREVATQAFLFVAAFLSTYLLSVILRILESAGFLPGDESRIFWLLVVQALFLPLMGFFNLLIYIRPRYRRTREQFPEESIYWSIKRALWGEAGKPSSSAFENSHFDSSPEPPGVREELSEKDGTEQ